MFIKATGNTSVEYMQRVKIESGKKAFEGSRKTINKVMYEVGYSDMKAFREVFRKITGISPLEYRSRYNKEAVGCIEIPTLNYFFCRRLSVWEDDFLSRAYPNGRLGLDKIYN